MELSYMKSGSAGIKGTQYEIRLSLLCCLDAVRNKRKFRLASNMSEARKWDDVVFHDLNTKCYRFIQAKCKKSYISRDNLLSETGDFSLVKYFFSCTDIHSSKTFKDSQKGFILCTTCNLKDLEEFTEQVGDLDVFQKPLYRFKSNLIPYLHPKLEDYCFSRIARQLAFVLFEDGCFGEGLNMQELLPILAKMIIDCKPSNATLSSSFIEDEDISEDARKFRTIFIQVLAKCGMDMSKLYRCIRNNEMHLSVTKGLGKNDRHFNGEWPVSNEAELIELAENLIACMQNRKSITLYDTIIKKYHSILAHEVIQVRPKANNLFHFEFLRENNWKLDETSRKFQWIFAKAVKEKAFSHKFRYKFPNGFQFSKLNQYLNDGILKLSICPSLQQTKCEEACWPKVLIEPKDVEEFFQQVIWAVEQPNEDQLREMIKKQCQVLTPFTKKSVDNVYDTLERLTTDWYKNTSGTWLTNETMVGWLAEATEQDAQLINPTINSKVDDIKWADLNENARNFLMNKTILFQGIGVKLNKILKREILDKVLNAELFSQLTSDTPMLIGLPMNASVGYDPDLYIERVVQYPTLDRDSFGDQYEIRKEGGDYILVNSTGPLDPLRKSAKGKKSYREAEILKAAKGVIIIADSPGTGKSTILTRLGDTLKKQDPHLWVVRVELNDTKVIASIRNYLKTESSVNFLAKYLMGLQTPLEEAVFQNRITKASDIVVLLDGLDEIQETFQDEIIRFVKNLKSQKINQIWISTRLHLKEKLENEFGHFAYDLKPLSDFEQVNFLVNYWQRRTQSQQQGHLRSKATRLVTLLRKIIVNTEKKLTGVPLQCQLLAEVYEDENEIPERLNLIALYKHFWSRKFDIYFHEKCKQDPNNIATPHFRTQEENAAIPALQKLALRTLFEDRPELWEHFPAIEFRPILGMTIGTESFIHPTFGEYFAAIYLFNNLQDDIVCKCIIEMAFTMERYIMVRTFINELLRSNPDRPLNKMGVNILRKFKSAQWAIRVATVERNSEIIDFLYKSLKRVNDDQASDQIGPLISGRNAEGKSPVHLALQDDNVAVMDQILKIAIDNNIDREPLGFLLGPDMNGRTPLHLAGREGDKETVDKILQIALNRLSPNVYLTTDQCGETALHISARWKKFEVVKTLIDFIENNSIDARPFLQPDYQGGSTPLHWVARAGNQEVAYMLMDLGLRSGMNPATFMGPDRFGSYPFQPEQGYHSVLRLEREADKS